MVMGIGLQKALSFILMIVVGLLLKKKIKTADQLSGIKTLILSVALPVTIFLALLNIELSSSLLLFPLLALFANLLIFLAVKLAAQVFKLDQQSTKYRTLIMMIPSLAPGISCFPLIAEYLGEESLAIAALGDIGNKFFVLIALYLLAMRFYYRLTSTSKFTKTINFDGTRRLLITLIKEPINLFMVIAIVLLSFGINLVALPMFLQDSLGKLGGLMTPLVLIFIGIAVKVKTNDIVSILQLLLMRSCLAFVLSALLIWLLPPGVAISTILVAVIFPQSAISFWPYAHMTMVNDLGASDQVKTFDLTLGVNLLACSLPFSTILILIICSTGNTFTKPLILLSISLLFLLLSALPFFLKKLIANMDIKTGNTSTESIREM